MVQIPEDGAVLLPQGVRDGHDALGVPLSALALGAVRYLAPKNERPEVAFGQIVCGVHVGPVHEGPKRGPMIENVGTGSAEAAYAEAHAALEEPLDALAHGCHPFPKVSTSHRAVANAVPGVEHQFGRFVQLPSDLRARPLALDEAGKLADQVRP